MKTLLFFFFLCILIPSVSFALPVDWHGVFGVDSAYIDSFRRVEAVHSQSTGAGTEEVPLANGDHANASFQTYILKLSPEIIVNDSSTFKAEFSTGYGRGGRLGDSSTTDRGDDMANALYYYNTNQAGSTTLNVNQFNMTLFSDTATYIIGRHSYSWGLGAVINEGKNIWDRLLYVRDGLTAKFKIGNFELSPYLSKLNSAGTSSSLTKATKGKEYGVSFLYDNPDKDIAFGLYYSKKQNNPFNSTVAADVQGTGSTSLGKTDTKLTDFYLRKSFQKFNLQVEIPIVSGEIGHLYNTTTSSKYSAKAFIFETKYDATDTFSISANFGSVSGHSGIESSYEAMYLNPNYQIANLLFRYNMYAVSDPQNKSVFDSYITNAKFIKLASTLKSERSIWTFAAIHAIANEAAKAGAKAYNHETNKLFVATQDQDENIGTELDVDFDYRWNNETHLGTSLGYLFAGDYYAYTNTGTENSAKNSFLLLFKSSLEF